MKLNPQQQLMADHHSGPLLGIAVAGSGKTTTIVANLVNKYKNDINPMHVMVTAFNKDAAIQIRNRIMVDYPGLPKMAPIGTSHSLFLKILREQGLSFKNIIPEWAAKETIKKALGRTYKNGEELSVLSGIGLLKNNLAYYKALPNTDTYERYTAICLNAACAAEVQIEDFHRAYEAYETTKRERQEIDMDDMLFMAWVVFKQKPHVLEYYQNKFKHVLVDEYQDTNEVQYQLYKMLAENNKNIIVVGDDDQAIYSFRGAYPEYIRKFLKEYPEAKYIAMEENYRSQGNILDVANNLIKNNENRYKKSLHATHSPIGKPLIALCEDERAEAKFIAELVSGTTYKYSQIAVLTRLIVQQAWIEEAFVKKGIPFIVLNGQSFFNRKEVKMLIQYLRFVKEPTLELAKELANKPYRFISNDMINDWHTFDDILRDGTVSQSVQRYYEQLDWLICANGKYSIHQILEFICNNPCYFAAWCSRNANMTSDTNPINIINQFCMMTDGQTTDSMLDLIDEVIAHLEEKTPDSNRVRISTIHSAKGLEWEEVYIPGVVDEIIPSRSNNDTEEERRLFYVGITRARTSLVMTSYKKNGPSPFLEELGETIERIVHETEVQTQPPSLAATSENAEQPMASMASGASSISKLTMGATLSS